MIPLDPGHGRTMPDGKVAVWRTRDAGSSWQRLDKGLPSENAYIGVLREGMTIDDHDTPGLYWHEHGGSCSRAQTRARAGVRSVASSLGSHP